MEMTKGSAGPSVSPRTAGSSRAEAVSLFHDVGSIAGPGAPSEATDINDRGDVVGITSLPGTQVTHAFIMNPQVNGGRLTDIMPSESRSSLAEAVNRLGIVAGTLGVGLVAGTLGPPEIVSPPVEPFVWGPLTGLDILPLPPGASAAQAVDINDEGRVLVVGTGVTGVGLPRGLPVGSYLWDPASRTYTPLPPPDQSVTRPIPLGHTLDEHGGVAGGLVTQVGEQTWQHTAVVWEPGTLVPYQLTGGGADSFANNRNENGLIVGWRNDAPGGSPTAVYWPAPDALPVDLPGRAAFKVNDAGQIVGIGAFPASSVFPFTAVIWEPGRGRTADLGDKNLGSYVLAVNASGQSVGHAVVAGEGGHYKTACWWDSPPVLK
jgi:uncharacterized membrane protein